MSRLPVVTDWDESQGYALAFVIIPNSPGYRRMITGLIEWLTWGRMYNEKTGSILGALDMGREVAASLMITPLDELNAKVERIALALESINEKAVERYTYEELLEDLETAFGVGNALTLVVGAIVGLMPNLKAKVDFTSLAQSFIETWTRWRPLQASAVAGVAALGAIAASLAAGKIISIIDTVLHGLDVVGNGWRSLILGDKNIIDDVLSPIWKWLIPSGLGGEGGEDPDGDKDNRISVYNQFTANVFNSVNAVCCDGLSSIGSNELIYSQPYDSDTADGELPPDGPIPWEGYTIPADGKCQAAHYIVSWLIAFYGDAGWSGSLGLGSTALFAKVQETLIRIPPLGVTLAALSSWLGRSLTYAATGNTDLFARVNSVLGDNQEGLVCALYNADDVPGARAAFLAVIEADGRIGPGEVWSLDVWLSVNNVLNLLFWSDPAVDVSTQEDDCSVCQEEYPCHLLSFGISTGEEVDSSYALGVYEYVITPVLEGSVYVTRFGTGEEDSESPCYEYDLVNVTVSPGSWSPAPGSNIYGYRFYGDGAGEYVEAVGSPSTLLDVGRRWVLYSSVSVSFVVSVVPAGPGA